MKRKSFLKKLSTGVAAIVITPVLLSKEEPKVVTTASSPVLSQEDEFFKLESRKANKELIELFEKETDLVDIIKDMKKGFSLQEAIVRTKYI